MKSEDIPLLSQVCVCVNAEQQHLLLGQLIRENKPTNGNLITVMSMSQSRKVLETAFSAIKSPVSEEERSRLLYVCCGKPDFIERINNLCGIEGSPNSGGRLVLVAV